MQGRLGGRAEFAAERGLVDEVDERPRAVDLDYGEPRAIDGLERGIAADVDLLELEPELVAKQHELRVRAVAELVAQSHQLGVGPRAQRAAVGVEEGDPSYG